MFEYIKRFLPNRSKWAEEQERYLHEMRDEYAQCRAIQQHWIGHIAIMDLIGWGAFPSYYTDPDEGASIAIEDVIGGCRAYNSPRFNRCVVPLIPIQRLYPDFERVCLEALNLAAEQNTKRFNTLEDIQDHYDILFNHGPSISGFPPKVLISFIIAPYYGPLRDMAERFLKDHPYVRLFHPASRSVANENLIALPGPEWSLIYMPTIGSEFGFTILKPSAVCKITL